MPKNFVSAMDVFIGIAYYLPVGANSFHVSQRLHEFFYEQKATHPKTLGGIKFELSTKNPSSSRYTSPDLEAGISALSNTHAVTKFYRGHPSEYAFVPDTCKNFFERDIAHLLPETLEEIKDLARKFQREFTEKA